LSEADQRVLNAALQGAVVFGRDDRALLWVRGRDRLKFLHNMLTQKVRDLPEGAVRSALLCTAEGAITAEMTLVVLPDAVALWTDRARLAQLEAGLDRYIIMDDVELATDDDAALVQLCGPRATAVAGLIDEPTDLAIAVTEPVPGWRWRDDSGAVWWHIRRDDLARWVPSVLQAGATVGCQAAVEALRVAAGQPKLGVDIDDGSLPHEAGLGAAVYFAKGCFLGQEAMVMMRDRGQLRRHLCWVEPVEGVADTGWTLRTSEGKRAGRMGSMVVRQDGALGLAMVQRKAFAPGAVLTATSDSGDTATVRVRDTTVAGALAPEPATGSGEAA
jgi:folate-binding protein YgfZ